MYQFGGSGKNIVVAFGSYLIQIKADKQAKKADEQAKKAEERA
jgi:hypothetical protein